MPRNEPNTKTEREVKTRQKYTSSSTARPQKIDGCPARPQKFDVPSELQ